MPPKGKAKGYQKPIPIPNGEILTDIAKQQWKIGPSIGSGGFGEIYSASKLGNSTKDFSYVVKIEPHGNGPLFVEMHFYTRAAKLSDIERYRKQRKLKSLGMPHYVASGSHELNGIKHRFIVMPRYGRDVWSFFLENGKRLPEQTVYRIAIQMLDVLEYIHHCTYTHADLKGANILLGYGKSGGDQVYLVDFGLASHYTTKDFKPDPKKMHNGTIEYTSRDAHDGVPTMRSDMEILAYNIVHWLGATLPWEAEGLLAYPKKVQESKVKFISGLTSSLKKCFPACPDVITNYLKYVAALKYDDTPDYDKCRKIFETALKQLGETNAGNLKFTMTPSAGSSKKPTARHSNVDKSSPSPKKRPVNTKILPKYFEESESDTETSKIESNSPVKRHPSRKRIVTEAPTSASKNSDKRQKTERTVKVDEKNSLSTEPGSIVINNELTPNGKKKTKTYNFNIELNVSFGANVVVNVTRKPKENNIEKEKIEKVPKLNNPGSSDDDEDVIPNSNENSPVPMNRVFKKKIGTQKITIRKSPR